MRGAPFVQGQPRWVERCSPLVLFTITDRHSLAGPISPSREHRHYRSLSTSKHDNSVENERSGSPDKAISTNFTKKCYKRVPKGPYIYERCKHYAFLLSITGPKAWSETKSHIMALTTGFS